VDAEVISVSFLKDTAMLRLHYLKDRSVGNMPGKVGEE